MVKVGHKPPCSQGEESCMYTGHIDGALKRLLLAPNLAFDVSAELTICAAVPRAEIRRMQSNRKESLHATLGLFVLYSRAVLFAY